MPIQIKRVYEPVEAKDGLRILVDGLWPRGLSKQSLELYQWCKRARAIGETAQMVQPRSEKVARVPPPVSARVNQQA